jgi:hypothetical protein
VPFLNRDSELAFIDIAETCVISTKPAKLSSVVRFEESSSEHCDLKELHLRN